MGSTGTILSQLMRKLKDSCDDVQIDVITTKHMYRTQRAGLPSRENWEGIRIFRVNAPRTKRRLTALRLLSGTWLSIVVLVKLLLAPKYDLVFVVTNPPTLPSAAYWLRKIRRTPYVYLIHDLFPDVVVGLGSIRKQGTTARLTRSMQRKWLHGAARVVVLGRCMKDYLVRNYGLPEARVEAIPNWADSDQICPMDKATTKFRAMNNLTGFIVLYAGNFGQYQSFDNILDAAKELRSYKSDITFLFVGDGAKKDFIAETIEKDQLTNCRIFGFVARGGSL